MDALMSRISQDFEDMKSEIITDPLVEKWTLADPYLIVTIIVAYLFFVLKLGPDMMKGREAFDLKGPMIIYNAFQVLFNLKIVLAMFLTENAISTLSDSLCEVKHPEYHSGGHQHPLHLMLIEFGWFYLVSKITDLLDTVFFVLRKKQSHITFLHVYHHASLVFVSWAYLKYIRGYQGVIIGFINATVHVVMYFYYFLTSFGDTFKPFLFWKPYITKFQLAQFAFIIAYLGSLILMDCKLPKVYSYYMLANGMLFFYLFWDFYQKAYSNTGKQSKTSKTASVKKPEKPIAVPGSDFWKVITHGMSFMCFPGLQDDLYNDEPDDKTQ